MTANLLPDMIMYRKILDSLDVWKGRLRVLSLISEHNMYEFGETLMHAVVRTYMRSGCMTTIAMRSGADWDWEVGHWDVSVSFHHAEIEESWCAFTRHEARDHLGTVGSSIVVWYLSSFQSMRGVCWCTTHR